MSTSPNVVLGWGLVLVLGGGCLLLGHVQSEGTGESEPSIVGGDVPKDAGPVGRPPVVLAAPAGAHVDALMRTLRRGDASARADAARDLARDLEADPSHDDGLDALAQALRDPDVDVRFAARRALRRLGRTPADAVATLLDAAARRDEPEAVDTLRTLGASCGRRPDAIDALTRELRSPSAARARAAAEGLVLAGEDGLRALSAALDGDADIGDALRGVTARAVGSAEAARLSATLGVALRSAHAAVRRLALRSFATLEGSRADRAALTAFLASGAPEEVERRLAEEALERW